MRHLPIIAALCLLLAPCSLIGQNTASILVNVKASDGSSLHHGGVVNLYTITGVSVAIGKMKDGQVDFEGLSEGRYSVEVIATGYQKVIQEADVAIGGERVQVYITVKPDSGASAIPEPSGAPRPAADSREELGKTPEARRGNKLERAWMPPDVDESMPAVEAGVACPLQKVQDEAAKRVHAFVDGVNRISATEVLDQEAIDERGRATKHETRKFSYVESLQEIKPGAYRLEEYRNGTTGMDVFPEHIASLGLGALVMIFHPAYRNEYEVSCEGLSRWHGSLAWQVHFRQRNDRPVRLRQYTVAKQIFPVALRGRAWIAADSYQVVSLETDIVAPIPQIQLKAEHITVEYAPVKFHKDQEELWLPQNAELFLDLGSRRIHRRHHFSDYLLFSVDEDQKIAAPTARTESDTAPAARPNF
jgi:hypothetical protein